MLDALRSSARTVSGSHAIARYAMTAVLSIVANLVAQQITVVGAPATPLMASIVVGTIVGFVAKYAMDKTWTFREAYTTPAAEAHRITLSGLLSLGTTVIFWAFELGFLAIWQTDIAKYTGAVIGLSIGYTAKFWLDRRHVFRDATA